MAVIEIILLAVLVIICILGLLVVPLGIPGIWVIPLVALAYRFLPIPIEFSWIIILVLAGLALLAEILEYYLGAKSASKAGATKWGVIGAIIGGIAGAVIGVPIFLVGSVIGMFIGAFLGAFIVEFFIKENIEKAFKAGIGAFKGRVGAILVKELIGLVMTLILVISAF